MRHILTKTGEVRPDRKCADFKALRATAAQYIKNGRGVAEFMATMGRQGYHDDSIFIAFSDANKGML